MENKLKTSKLAILSGFCAAIVAFIFFIIFPYIAYWDDVDKSGPGTPYDSLLGLFMSSVFVLWIVILLGVPLSLLALLRIKKNRDKLRGNRIASISLVVCTLPIILYMTLALISQF
jgi:cytochrome bd-type quinol oxidase subunit 2